jgi:apolipoprotein N-acyltransferase
VSRQQGQNGSMRGLRLLVLAVACTALAVAFYGSLAWLAGLVVIGPVAVLSGRRRRQQARRGLRRAARVTRQTV